MPISSKESESQKIIPHLWFDNQAQEAAAFYTSIFDRSYTGPITHYGKAGFDIHGQPEGHVMTVEFELEGYRFIALNGGPHFTFNPAISFFVTCETEEEIDRLWEQLIEGGTPLMPLDTYDWSNKYGWLQDRYGVSWQLYRDNPEKVGQKICPSLMFVGDQHGRAVEAIQTYTQTFPDSGIMGIMQYSEEEDEETGTVKHAQFNLGGEQFMAMDSSLDHPFTFNEAVSLLVKCKSQEEVDHYWNKLSAVPEAEQCGWLKDQFGVSWQITPTLMHEMLRDADSQKVERLTESLLQMKKLDINRLKEAFEGKSASSSKS